MRGLMQPAVINLISVLQHAARWHGEQVIVANSVEGGIRRQTYARTYDRTAQLAHALAKLGVQPGDRIATCAWNTERHVEAWYAIMGLGAIAHTLNPRLFPDQVDFIVNDAEDRILLLDLSFVPIFQPLLERLPTLEKLIVMTDRAHMPEGLDDRWLCYEDLIADEPEQYDWVEVQADTASSLCYTSGTTGNPKGVLYSHMSNILHSYAAVSKDCMDLGSADAVLMVVPMFHANAWGLAFALPMTGARMVMPGPHMDGASIQKLLIDENCTFAAAVPTVWTMLLTHLAENGGGVGPLRHVVIGGAAVPRSMIETFDREFGVDVLHAWGMTEMSPLGTLNRPTGSAESESADARYDLATKQGRVPFGVDMKILGEKGQDLPHDGESFGRLMVRGPWVVERYYNQQESALENGWFDTGDIATIDRHGYMQITDRAKDVIKSGGEWISSVDIENAAIGHCDVALAACIGAAHPKWDERPLLLVKPTGDSVDSDSIMQMLADQFAKWQLPEAIVEVEEIPLTATGKIDKKPLREEFGDYFM